MPKFEMTLFLLLATSVLTGCSYPDYTGATYSGASLVSGFSHLKDAGDAMQGGSVSYTTRCRPSMLGGYNCVTD